MSFIGQLLIELGINTAAFKDGLDKSTYQAKKFTGDLKKEFGELGNTLQSLAGEFGSLAPAIAGPLEVVQSAFRSLSTVWEGTEKGIISGMGGVVVAGAGMAAAVVAVGAAWATLGIEGGELAERLELISLKTGLSIQTLQTYEAAGRTVQVSLEDMVGAMRKFDQALANNGKGAAAAQATLKSLGVTAHDPKEALEQVAEAFKNLDDPVVRSADAVVLFGKAGLNMIPFLVKGKEGLKEFEEIVEQYGPHITGDVLQAQEKWEKSTTELNLAWQSMKVSATGALNVLASGIDKVAYATKYWGDVMGKHLDEFKDFYSLITTGKLSTEVTAKLNADPNQAAKDAAAADKKRQAAEAQLEIAREGYELAKAGSQAQRDLDKQREEIAALVAANKFDEAKAAQQEIPALQAAVDAEKARLKTLQEFPANVIKARDAIVAAFKDVGGQGVTDPIDKIEQKSNDAIQRLQKLDQQLGDKVFGAAFQGGLAGAIHQIDQLTSKLKDEEFQKQMDKIVEVVAKLDKANLASNLSFLSQGLPDKDHTGAVFNAEGLYDNAKLSIQEYDFELQKLHNEFRKGKITQDQYNQALQQLNQSMGGVAGGVRLFFEEFKNDNTSAAILTFDLLNQGIHGFEDNLAQALATGKANWADYFASLEEMILKSSINNLLKSALGFLNDSSFFGGLAGGNLFGSGGIFSGLSGGKASGGNVMAGNDYLVGEKGPEIFRPGVGGTIIPNGSSAGMQSGSSISIIQNISTPDANSFRRSKGQIASEMYRDAAVAHNRMRT